MEVHMAKHDENGLFAMIDRLFRALMAMVWIATAILVPLIASVRIAEAIRRRRASRDKYERAYWTSQIRLYVCTMYIAIAVYVQIMQDILLLPFSIDQRTVIMERVNTILGVPGVIWYAFIDRTTAMQGDPDKFLVASLSIAMIVWCYYFAKDHSTLRGLRPRTVRLKTWPESWGLQRTFSTSGIHRSR
ncbi:hypothetical protein WT14_16775 [Burkholderia stagnalis]|nr:hypothetical protein WT14_16775 [Burkholderia stagnalis]